MKKYRITYINRFTSKTNNKAYVSMELQSLEVKVSAEGTPIGKKTFSILASAGNVPPQYCYDGIAECCISFDKKTGKAFGYNFKVPSDVTFADTEES